MEERNGEEPLEETLERTARERDEAWSTVEKLREAARQEESEHARLLERVNALSAQVEQLERREESWRQSFNAVSQEREQAQRRAEDAEARATRLAQECARLEDANPDFARTQSTARVASYKWPTLEASTNTEVAMGNDPLGSMIRALGSLSDIERLLKGDAVSDDPVHPHLPSADPSADNHNGAGKGEEKPVQAREEPVQELPKSTESYEEIVGQDNDPDQGSQGGENGSERRRGLFQRLLPGFSRRRASR